MHRFTSQTTGRMMLLIGIVSIIGIILLLIFFVGYFQNIPSLYFFGPLNDISGSLEAILCAVLAVMLLPAYGRSLLWIHIPLAALGWLGAVIVTVDSMVMGGFMSSSMEFQLSYQYGLSFITEQDLHFGFGLIGIWVMALNYHAHQNNLWPRNLISFGFLTSAFLMTGLFSTLAGFSMVILFPIWTILLGRWILSARMTAT